MAPPQGAPQQHVEVLGGNDESAIERLLPVGDRVSGAGRHGPGLAGGWPAEGAPARA